MAPSADYYQAPLQFGEGYEGFSVSRSRRHSVRLGSLFCTFFTNREVVDYASAKMSDTKRYAKFFHAMLERGVYLAPSQFEVGFVSLAHTEADIEETLRAASEAAKIL